MIKKLLEWALSLFGPTKKEQVEAWPFPVESEKKPIARKKRTPAKKVVATKVVAKKKSKAKK